MLAAEVETADAAGYLELLVFGGLADRVHLGDVDLDGAEPADDLRAAHLARHRRDRFYDLGAARLAVTNRRVLRPVELLRIERAGATRPHRVAWRDDHDLPVGGREDLV